VPTSSEGKVNIPVLQNQQEQTDRIIPKTKPHIINRDDEKETCALVDAAISGDRNAIKKKVENNLKYTDITIEISACRT
jgi:hypothetical protein